ncbi:hypothetical protein BYT27DRAFT_7338779 [Phlegmacium glaucopus]|nr:hypothetical protein BYT27DRAFT_7338779 [Phlegmacium glaucopus]
MDASVSSATGVRHRVIRHSLRKLKKGELPTLGPGEMQLYSFYSPGLATGMYNINAKQEINASGEKKTITAPMQSFFVTAPRFSIDSNLIHSTFPLPGVSAHPNILPHIVFNDPHLPWQTAIGTIDDSDIMRIPWLAVIAFEQSELHMTADDTVFPQGFGSDSKQSFTMSSRMTLATLTRSGLHCIVPNLDQAFAEDPSLPNTKVDVIFPKKDLFLALFSVSASSPSIDLDRYKYLAHARQVNTTHMTDSGVIDEGTFSIVFSHRTGPHFGSDASPTTPKPCVVHLVSLDAVNSVPKSSLTSGYTRAALVSLFSWTYDCLPPETLNFEDVMRKVGKNCKAFGTPKAIRHRVVEVPVLVRKRIHDGYTLLRYRVQTGEETVALMRGPLTPCIGPDTPWLDVHSNTGEDLQIIDKNLGLIDISYSAAWQLGKSLAIADQAFCAALLRIRSDVYNYSNEQAKQEKLSSVFEAATSDRVIKSLPTTLLNLTEVASNEPTALRWARTSLIHSRYKHLGRHHDSKPDKAKRFQRHLAERVHFIASATDGTSYTEFNDPNSTDWSLVLDWLMDKIYLDGIPPYYLIPDPTWLPSECIRFFHVDRKWLNALVDGALSIANHLDKDDRSREAIKKQLQNYLSLNIHPNLKHPPQTPVYGFFLRSVAVDVFPDLVVRAKWDASNPKAEVLRQENIRKDVMFCLLDRTPNSAELDQLTISQPPHQQCFAFGHDGTFTDKSFELVLRKVYGVHTEKSMEEIRPSTSYVRDDNGVCDIYDWNWRTIYLDKFAKVVQRTLETAHKNDSDIYDKETNAALIGIELNDPIYKLTFTSQSPSSDSEAVRLPAEEAPAIGYDEETAHPSVRSQRSHIPPSPSQSSLHKSGLPPQSLLVHAKDAVANVKSVTSSDTTTPATESDTYDSMETCSPRFSPLCFACGDIPSTIPEDDDFKPVLLDPNGTDIIFRLVRSSSSDDSASTDYISAIKVTIPLGNESSCLLSVAPGMYDAKMLNNPRLLPLIRTNAKSVTVELIPKPATGLTLLSHNKDLSFVIKRTTLNSAAENVTIDVVELYTTEGGNSKVATSDIEYVYVDANDDSYE